MTHEVAGGSALSEQYLGFRRNPDGFMERS
jgi:hypothetical protein